MRSINKAYGFVWISIFKKWVQIRYLLNMQFAETKSCNKRFLLMEANLKKQDDYEGMESNRTRC